MRTSNARYISLEMPKCKEPTLEAWIDLVIELSSGKGRRVQKQRSKHRIDRRVRTDISHRPEGQNGHFACGSRLLN